MPVRTIRADGRLLIDRTRFYHWIVVPDDIVRVTAERMPAEAFPRQRDAASASEIVFADVPFVPRRERNPAQAGSCAALAADPDDELGPSPGVVWEMLDARTAISACRKEVDAFPDNAAAWFHLGRAYSRAEMYSDAYAALGKAVELAYPPAMTLMGSMYQKGNGVLMDYREAVRYYRMAANAGDAAGLYSLGSAHEFGLGLSKDEDAAVQSYHAAAKKGYLQAVVRIGQIYASPSRARAEQALGLRLLETAAAKGSSEAALAAAHVLLTDDRTNEGDVKHAVELLGRAGTQGEAVAWITLGDLYRDGEKLSQDLHKAAELYERAANAGIFDAFPRLVDLYRSYSTIFSLERQYYWARVAIELGPRYMRADMERHIKLVLSIIKDAAGIDKEVEKLTKERRERTDG